MQSYVQELDVVTRFISDRCTLGDGKQQRRSEMHAAFKAWCTQEGETHWSSRKFNATLKKRRFTSVKLAGFDTWKGIQLNVEQAGGWT